MIRRLEGGRGEVGAKGARSGGEQGKPHTQSVVGFLWSGGQASPKKGQRMGR